jgi:murein endopeptidase
VRTICLIVLTSVGLGFAAQSVDVSAPAPAPREKVVHWRESRALGTPADGRLVRGVQLPASGTRFFTWDPLLHRKPDRPGRRWGTDLLVRTVLRVVTEYAVAHPLAPRLGIGDLSRHHGGPFGPRHASHQNGLDVDVYYTRTDRRERPPRVAAQIDHRLAQDLVDSFVAAGAVLVFVGPNTGLTGPRGVVEVLWNHDNHLHARFTAHSRP